MKRTYLYLKNKPVLEIEDYVCRILDYDLLPVSLRYKGVNFDDVMHGWTESRSLSIGRTNAKKILAGFGISQSNPYIAAKLFHFVSLTDCYWIKEEGEPIVWEDVSLFSNRLERTVASTALMGVQGYFKDHIQDGRTAIKPKLHTPELTAQGMSAKAWIREEDGIWLYKIGKKELAASRILDALGIPHVKYEEAPEELIITLADEKHRNKIRSAKEKVVKSKIITSEKRAIFSWEEFQMYCAYREEDEFSYVKSRHPYAYYSMQIADYILGNEDRHGANWGFFMDNDTGNIGELYPLMDHDQGFSDEEDILSQTSEKKETLKEAALNAVRLSDWGIDYEAVLRMEQPEELSREQWEGVKERTRCLIQEVHSDSAKR